MATTPTTLKVLAVTNLWPVGDSFRGIFVKEQVEALRRRGIQVDVEVVSQDRGIKDYLLAAWRIRRIARKGSYDIVHVHYGLTGIATHLAGSVPRVVSLYGSDINVRWQRILTRIGWRGVQARIYVAPNLAANAADQHGDIIPDGVDLDLFHPVDRQHARTQLGIAPDEVVLLFAGSPENTVKGYDIFTDVLRGVQAQGINVGELILAAANQPRHMVPLKFAAADVLLFTSRQGSEGSPSVIKEAAAVGLPVVSVDVGDVSEVLRGVVPSAVVPFRASQLTVNGRRQLVNELVTQTIRVLGSDSRSNGRDRAMRYEVGHVADQIIDVYQRVLADERDHVASVANQHHRSTQ